MDEEGFWELIDRSRQRCGPNAWQQAALLSDWLSEFDPKEIISFQEQLNAQTRKAYRADLWDVVSVVTGSCSEDAFADFLAWLVQQGKKVYDAVLADPESLSDFIGRLVEPEGSPHCEAMLYVPTRAYRRRTKGHEMPEDLRDREDLRLQGSHLTDEQIRKRFPKLWQSYFGSED